MSTEEIDWLQTVTTDDVYQALLMTLLSDRVAQDVAETSIHNSLSWTLVWQETTKDLESEKNQILMKRLKMVIWHQTVMAIGQHQTQRCA